MTVVGYRWARPPSIDYYDSDARDDQVDDLGAADPHPGESVQSTLTVAARLAAE